MSEEDKKDKLRDLMFKDGKTFGIALAFVATSWGALIPLYWYIKKLKKQIAELEKKE